MFGDVLQMPFESRSFDLLYVTCLPYLPEDRIDPAIKEMFRVCRSGLLYQGTTTDMTEEVIAHYQMFAGLRTFWTFKEWADAFVRNGFKLTVDDPVSLDRVWRVEQETYGDFEWYPNKESLRYSFFEQALARLRAPLPAPVGGLLRRSRRSAIRALAKPAHIITLRCRSRAA